jgi:nicotinate-nucleotide adenylyltransferase
VRIGIFGGTFNPVHTAHVCVAACARDSMHLDSVVFVPAPSPPHKTGHADIAPAQDRLNMLRLALEESPWAQVSDVEFRRSGPSYTIDTVREYKTLLPALLIVLIVGSDTLADLKNWRSIDELVKLVEFAVIFRDGRDWAADYAARPPESRVHRVVTPYSSGLSASAIRETKNFESVHPKVAAYIREKHLYGL